MKDWKVVKLGEVLKPSENSVLVEAMERYKLLGMSLEGRGLFIREEKLGSEVSAKFLNKVKPNEFMFSRLFAWKGAFDKVGQEFQGCFVSDEFPAFQNDAKVLNIDFLNYYFRQKKVWIEVEQFCTGVTKASRNRFKEKFLLEMKIPLPPLPEQERIVARLDALHERVRQARQVRAEQEKIKNKFLFSLFKDLIDKYNFTPLENSIKQRKGFIEISDDSSYKLCRVQTSARGVVLRQVQKGLDIKTKKQQVCKAGDFLVAEIDAKMGGYGIVPEKLEGAIVSSHYFLFEANESILDKYFLDYFSKTSLFFEQVKAEGSTNYAAIRPKDVLEYKIPLPPLPEQKRIVEILAKFEEMDTLQKEQLALLEGLLPSVLDKAFRGEW